MRSEALKEAQRRYNSKSLKIKLVINPDTEKDLYDALKKLKNKQGYIKAKLRESLSKK